ncbi:MAG: hypothetical protein ACK5AZ_25885, partial [Bryobacteraceae bacterium]
MPRMLQWGRDQLIAELTETAPASDEPAGASMGPRSADRGITVSAAMWAIAPMLQWGRDQLIA